MLLSDPFRGAFGLDIGDLSIKLVQLLRKNNLAGEQYYQTKEIRVVNLPPGYIVNGEIEQPELVRKKLLQILGKEGSTYPRINTPWVVSDLPETRTFLKLIQIDTPGEQVSNDDVLYQAKKHLPFELDEAYLDWQLIVSSQSGKSQILIGAVPKVVADAHTYLLESAELQPLALEIEAISIVRTMITKTKTYSGEARAILDVGATRSSLIIFDHNSIQFSMSLAFSGELLTTAISQQLKVDYETAEKLKIKNGLTVDRHHPKYLKTVADLTENFINQIVSGIKFYKDHFANTNPVTHITMCGGLANLLNLDNLISRRLKISAHPGNAWKNILLGNISEEEKSRGAVLISALGLAMRAAHEPLTTDQI